MTDRMNLPDAVRARLDLTEPSRGVTADVHGRLEEARDASRLELRADEDAGTFAVEGYASTFDTPYDVAGGAPYGWTEVIRSGAFTKALAERDDVRFLLNHDGIPLARTKSGTLTLAADPVGLRMSAPSVDMANPTAQELRSALDRGDVDEMSFAFRVTRQEWNDDYTERQILEVRLFDVAAVTYPANPATAIQLVRTDDDPTTEGHPLRLARAQADALRFRRTA